MKYIPVSEQKVIEKEVAPNAHNLKNPNLHTEKSIHCLLLIK